MCVHTCVVSALLHVLPVWWGEPSGTTRSSEERGTSGASGWHLAKLLSPGEGGIVPVAAELKGKHVAMASGKVFLRPDLLRDEPLVIST